MYQEYMDLDHPSYTKSGIPKIIHQTWKTKDIPEKWKLSEQEWKRLHPGWIHHVWTDEEIRNHVATRHPDLLELHDSYPYPIQRADMIRYLVLHDYGGVYSDLDLYPVKNIESYLIHRSDYVVYSANSNYFTNALMIAKKHSPIHRELMEALKNPKPWWALVKHLHVMCTTGPVLFHTVLKSTRYPYSVLPQALFNPYSISDSLDDNKGDVFIKTLEGSSWHSWDSKLINVFFKNRIFFMILGVVLLFLLIAGFIYLMIRLFYVKNRMKIMTKQCGELCSTL